jgi:hypothetical protein
MDDYSGAELTAALIKVKRALYRHFLDTTERDNEQDVDIIVKDYPRYLAEWATNVLGGKPVPAGSPDFLKSALEDLKRVMVTAEPAEVRRLVEVIFIRYPYTYNTNDM